MSPTSGSKLSFHDLLDALEPETRQRVWRFYLNAPYPISYLPFSNPGMAIMVGMVMTHGH